MNPIERKAADHTLAVTDSLATTPAIEIAAFNSGRVDIPATASITSLVYHVCATKDGTYLPAYDSAGNLLTIATVTNTRSYALPSALFDGSKYLKLLAGAAGTIGIQLKT